MKIESRIQNKESRRPKVRTVAKLSPTKCQERASGTVAAETGQWRAGMWVQPGKGGQMMGERTGFSHLVPASTRLGPDNSTQVVDFPHLTHVRLFWQAVKWVAMDETWIKHGLRTEIEPEGSSGNGDHYLDYLKCVKFIADFYAVFRGFPQFYARNRAVFTRFLASQARHKLDAPNGLFACAKRGRIFTGDAYFFRNGECARENGKGQKDGLLAFAG